MGRNVQKLYGRYIIVLDTKWVGQYLQCGGCGRNYKLLATCVMLAAAAVMRDCMVLALFFVSIHVLSLYGVYDF